MKAKKIKIKDLKIGKFFKLKNTNSSPVWVRDEYVRELKKYACYKFDDVNHEKFLKGTQIVFVGFTF